MRTRDIEPTGVERTFADDEIIVSKTDAKGIITYANDLFLTVSGYPEDQVIGQPHNVIRHPEMPRAIFGLLWEKISSGNEIFAYVVNMASDGGHYWVLAHVTPTRGPGGAIVGFHSNRRTASRSALDLVEPLYRKLRAEERKHGSGRDALVASTAMLTALLDEQGMSYDEFVWSLDPEVANVGSTAQRGAA